MIEDLMQILRAKCGFQFKVRGTTGPYADYQVSFYHIYPTHAEIYLINIDRPGLQLTILSMHPFDLVDFIKGGSRGGLVIHQPRW